MMSKVAPISFIQVTQQQKLLVVQCSIQSEGIYNPITAMGFLAIFTSQLDNTKSETMPAPHCRNGSCRYLQAVQSEFLIFIDDQWNRNTMLVLFS